MTLSSYIPVDYWNEVARRIRNRKKQNLVAGDDEPFYHYKRQKFLSLLNSISFSGKKILEVGPGPGGNLLEIHKQAPAELHGVDISDEMLALAKETIGTLNIILHKTDGKTLDFPNRYFDIVITATVLQHITDEKILMQLVSSICKVSGSDVYLFERIEQKRKETNTNIGRTINEYAALFNQHDFYLKECRFADLHVSYITSGLARKLFNKQDREEGEQASPFSKSIQKTILPFTRQLDKVFKPKRDLAMLHFKKGDI